MAQPLLHGERLAVELKTSRFNVMHAHLGHHRELPERSRIGIASNVPESFVPDITAAILPTIGYQDWMNRGPAYFRVPKPQRRLRRRTLAPSLNVRFVPFDERLHGVSIAWEPIHPVGTIGDDANR